MFNVKTALVALATTLCVTLTFSESAENSKKEKLKSKVRHHLRHHALTQNNSRSKDTLWDCTNGWNYFEVLTVQYPTEIFIEVYGELLLESIMDGPSQYTDFATFFGDGWHKAMADQKLITTSIENVTLSNDGHIESGDTSFVDSVHYGDTLVSMQLITSGTNKGVCTFYPNGHLKKIDFKARDEAIHQLFCSYNEKNELSEYILREIDLDAGISDGGYQERYTLTYNENNRIKSVISVDEMLDPDLKIVDTDPGDTVLYNYNAEGTLTEIITIASWAGNSKARSTYIYDESDRLAQSVTYSWDTIANAWGHDRWDDSTLFTYDNSGNIVAIEEFEYENDQFSLAYTYDYEFDAKGNLTGELHYDYESGTKTFFDSSLYNYNEQNNLTTMTYYDAPGALPEITAVTYSDGLPSEIIETVGDSLNLFELSWETITPIVHSQLQSKSIKPQVRRIGDRLLLSGADITNAQLFTVQGKAIQRVRLKKSGKISQLNLNGLASGTYLLKIHSRLGAMTSKIQL